MKFAVPVFPSGGWKMNRFWLHMEYEIFSGTFTPWFGQEFFTEIRDALIPFLDPATLWRSICRNYPLLLPAP